MSSVFDFTLFTKAACQRAALASFSGALLILGGPAIAQQPTSSRPSLLAVSSGKVAPESRHQPDAATQQFMLQLRAQLSQQRVGIEQQLLNATAYLALADRIDAQLDELARSAGSPPSASRKAFGALVERDLRWATDLIRRSPKADVQRMGALAMFQALRHYGMYFDHPGWNGS